jgi:COP9 signalosome complex subunit 3
VVSRQLKNASAPYDDIVKAFEADNESALSGAIDTGRYVLEADRNYGMSKQVHSWLFRRRLMRLAGIYSKIRLDNAAQQCGLASAAVVEREILALVHAGLLTASINKCDATVSFGVSLVQSNEELVLALMPRLRESMELADILRAAQRRFYSSKAYVQRVVPRPGSETSVQMLPGEDYDMEFA